jgi:predicted Zn-dependent peptidase
MEGDRMRNPVFREFYTERDVVAEERRLRVETSPGGLLYQAHLAEAFRVHPYGRPVIGTKEDLQNLTRADVREYFRTYYSPDNAVVAIVGDVDSDQIVRWARSYLGTVPKGAPPPPVEVTEPPQNGERRIRISFDAEPLLRIGWRVPSALHPDAPALAMLASILTGGRSSRLYQRLVTGDRLATGVTSGTGPGVLFPGLFSVDAAPRSPHTPEALEAAIYEELDHLAETPPEEIELQRVRNQLEASAVRRLQSNFGLAVQLAESETLFGDWRHSLEFYQSMESVTPQDIQRVVRTYFRAEGRTVAILSRPEENQGGVGP